MSTSGGARSPVGDLTDDNSSVGSKREGGAVSEAEAKRRKKKMAPAAPSGPGKKAGFAHAYEYGPGQFEPERHFYERVLNSQIHPMVSSFLGLTVERMATRYCHLHPKADYDALVRYMKYEPKYFRWAGSDLFNVTDAESRRQMVVIETNSCPSGQKSMPSRGDDADEAGGYRTLLEGTFLPLVCQDFHDDVKDGVLAVFADKNPVEYTGYAACLAELTGETVYVVQYHGGDGQPDPPLRFVDEGRIAEVRVADGTWKVVRAAFRYVTQKPWSRIPIITKTKILNPIIACLAGGRNKATAAKAYDFMNAELADHGLEIRVPETIKDVRKCEVPLWVKSFGGHAVVKDPFSNAGQGVYTITSEAELAEFMAGEYTYESFIVQALIGNSSWTSTTKQGVFYHTGTIPNKRSQTFVCDVRMMVSARAGKGFRPVAVYARRAHEPLAKTLTEESDSWAMLGTNLSRKLEDGTWTSETNRLVLMDRRDFNQLGIGIDDLIDAYVQTSLSCIAIDKLCCKLVNDQGDFDYQLFASLNDDKSLNDELAAAPGAAAVIKRQADGREAAAAASQASK